MLEGKVKWFSESKGFGFIISNGTEYFVHYKEINQPGFKKLKDGALVKFTPDNGPKGAIARCVVPLDESVV